MKHSFTCNKNDLRLSEFLSDSLEFVRKNTIKKQIKIGEVKINGIKIREDINLKSGDVVAIFLPESAKADEYPPEIIFEDKNVLIVYKPPLCDVQNHLVKILANGRSYLKPLHRLDRNTDGILAFALNETAYNELYSAFKERRIDKCYYALVNGNMSKTAETLTAYLKKDPKTYKSIIYSNKVDGAVKILTHYDVVKAYGGFSLLRVMPITGKTHQIRAHLNHIGHAILGDGKYAPSEVLKKFKYTRQQLTAYSICFHGLNCGLEYLNERTFSLKELPFEIHSSNLNGG